LRDIACGGQALVSRTTHDLVQDHLLGGFELLDKGEHGLKGLVRAERLYQLMASGLPVDFPPLSVDGQL